MDRAYRNLILPGGLLAACLALAFANHSTGDFLGDSAPAIAALEHLHLSAYFAARPEMGPLATLFEAPFSLLGTSPLSRYQWSCLAGLLAVAAVGWCLFGLARRRGASTPAATLLAFLCVVNPLTLEALHQGHPEEILTAALAVAAVLAAARGMSLRAGLLLGLAIASKQWAVLAIFPVAMAMPRRRLPSLGVAAAVVAASMLPGLIAAPGSFFDVQGNAASGGGIPSIWSAWYPVSPVATKAFPGIPWTVGLHEIPSALQPLTHPLLVASFFLVPLALAAWRGEFRLDEGQAFALLALLALLRCALDPVDNLYYHAPLLLALLAWDAAAPAGRLPIRGLLGAAVAFVFWRWAHDLGDLGAFNAAYLAVAAVGAALLVGALADLDRPAARRQSPRPTPVPSR